MGIWGIGGGGGGGCGGGSGGGTFWFWVWFCSWLVGAVGGAAGAGGGGGGGGGCPSPEDDETMMAGWCLVAGGCCVKLCLQCPVKFNWEQMVDPLTMVKLIKINLPYYM